jgi:hypothetical protein
MKTKRQPGAVRIGAERNENARTPRGTFAEGNACARGRRTPGAELREAVRGAVTGDELRKLLRKLLRRGLRGDTAAAVVVLDRTIGRAAKQPTETNGAGIDLGPLESLADIQRAGAKVIAAAARAEIDPTLARELAMQLRTAAELRVADIATRLDRVEQLLAARKGRP